MKNQKLKKIGILLLKVIVFPYWSLFNYQPLLAQCKDTTFYSCEDNIALYLSMAQTPSDACFNLYCPTILKKFWSDSANMKKQSLSKIIEDRIRPKIKKYNSCIFKSVSIATISDTVLCISFQVSGTLEQYIMDVELLGDKKAIYNVSNKINTIKIYARDIP